MCPIHIIIRVKVIMENQMIDLHTHILPGIDDGARCVDDSLILLREQNQQGVNSVVFTPHFRSDKKAYEDFIEDRINSLNLLIESKEFKSMNMSIKVGAEVYFSVNLANMQLDALCFSGTRYILIELPVNFMPSGLTYTLNDILNKGYVPIIAHVERYPYIVKNPLILYDLVDRGCLAQVNAATLLNKGDAYSMALKFIKWGLAQFLCSDCHSMKGRPPNLKDGLSIVKKRLGKQYSECLIYNAENVFKDKTLDSLSIEKPKKILGSWH